MGVLLMVVRFLSRTRHERCGLSLRVGMCCVAGLVVAAAGLAGACLCRERREARRSAKREDARSAKRQGHGKRLPWCCCFGISWHRIATDHQVRFVIPQQPRKPHLPVVLIN